MIRILAIVFGCAGLAAVAERQTTATQGEVASGGDPRAITAPLAFERNAGQHAAAVRYRAHSPGYTVTMRDDAVAVTLRGRDNRPAQLTMRFSGGRPRSVPTAEVPLDGRANYLIGSGPKSWRTDIPTFARVRYTQAFDGIDLVFYGHQTQLEYDVVVAPGANPRAARIAFDGAQSVRVDSDGSLALSLNGRELRYSKPQAYQEIGGRRVPVACRYQVNDSIVSFAPGSYDRAQRLVIDPVLIFSTFLGGSSYDEIYDVAVDLAGGIYVTGATSSDDFPATAGTYKSTTFASYVFVTKFSPGGGSIVYSTYIGPPVDGSDGSVGYAIAVDPRGYAYVAGITRSAQFPVTAGAFQTTFRGGDREAEETCGGCDLFVLKLNTAGSSLVYSTFLGGSGNEAGEGVDIAVDSAGSAYVASDGGGSDFPATGSATYGSAILARFNTTGSGLIFSKYLGAMNATAVALNDEGDAYVTGRAWVGLPVTTGAAQSTYAGNFDAYVMRLSKGGAIKYATYLGGTGGEIGRAIAVDANGYAYVAGAATGAFPTSDGAFQPCHDDSTDDAFVTQVSPTGTSFGYSTCVGGGNYDQALGIDVDIRGNATIAGFTMSSDYPRTSDGGSFHGGALDAVLTTLRSDGEALIYSSIIGGSDYERALAVRVDNAARRTVGGYTYSSDFPMHSPMFGFHSCRPYQCLDGFLHQYGNTLPGEGGAMDTVLYPANATDVHGAWRRVADAGAAGGARLEMPDAGAAKLATALAAPTNYFEMTASVRTGVPYALWLRGKAAGNLTSNDSVFVQFSDAVSDTGASAFAIGSTDAIAVVLEECTGCGLHGWAWQDGGYGTKAAGPSIARFTSETITVRVQSREDGISLDQIVLAPVGSNYWNGSPGYQKDDAIILPEHAGTPAKDIVLYPGVDNPSRHGAWTIVPDSTAAGGMRVVHADAGAAKLSTALPSPTHYFDLTFDVVPGVQYALWIRGKAQNDYWGNDSVFVQFTGSTNGRDRMWTIGTTSALEVNLEACSGCGLKGWGWQDTMWGSTAPPGGVPIFFDSEHQTMRVQTREDGFSIDQIVLSPNAYIDRAPGAAKNDTTIVPR